MCQAVSQNSLLLFLLVQTDEPDKQVSAAKFILNTYTEIRPSLQLNLWHL